MSRVRLGRGADMASAGGSGRVLLQQQPDKNTSQRSYAGTAAAACGEQGITLSVAAAEPSGAAEFL